MTEEETKEQIETPIYRRWYVIIFIIFLLFIILVLSWAITWWIFIITMIIILIITTIGILIKSISKDDKDLIKATTQIITHEQKIMCRKYLLDNLNMNGNKIRNKQSIREGIYIDQDSKMPVYWMKVRDHIDDTIIWNLACRVDNISVSLMESNLKEKEFEDKIRGISGTLRESEIQIKKARDPTTGAEYEIERIIRPIIKEPQIQEQETQSPLGG